MERTYIYHNMKSFVKILRGFAAIVLCIFSTAVFAQTDEGSDTPPVEIDNNYVNPEQSTYSFVVVSRNYGDSIVIRWAPKDAGLWRLASHYGWNIYRIITEEEELANPEDSVAYKLLNKTPIKAMTLEEMKAKYDSTNFYVGVAAQALYGESYYNPTEEEGMENYVFRREQEQSQRQAMAYMAAERSPHAATALGLRFVDKNVKPGVTYVYVIECLVSQDIAPTDRVTFLVSSEIFKRDYTNTVPNIFIHQNSPYTAFVYWGKNKLSGYYVERSEDKGKHWTALNDAPIFGYEPDRETYEVFGEEIGRILEDNVGTFDSLSLNKKYIYRVRAFDAFGDFTPYKESEVFEMEDLIPPAVPVLEFIVPKDNKECTLNWLVDKQDDDLDGYIVTFSDDPGGPWSNITDVLPPKTREWVDKNAHDRGRGYYRIFAVDKSGNVSYSLSQCNNIEDDVPPSPPTGLTGVVDTSGIVIMQWNQNPEKDILGYRVYFANQKDHDFIQRLGQRVEDTVFVDALDRNTLTKYVYFYVVAEDNSHNFSKPSDTLEVPVPDIVPPGVAVLKDYTQTDESVTFTWLQSTSEDVAAYYVYRKKDNEKQWKHVRIFTPDELKEGEHIVYTDFPEPSPVNYNYCIEVFDKGRLSSGKTGQTTVRFRGASVIEIPLDLKVSLNKAKTCATLDFGYEYESKKDYYGVIFKSVNDEPAYATASFRRGEKTYTDCNLNSNDKVRYHIQLFLGSGRRSQKSKEVIVRP